MTPITVWAAEDAAAALNVDPDFLLTHGGDEDWVAEVPPEFLDQDGEPTPPWLGTGTGFARCELCVINHPNKPGWKIAIGGHA